MKKGGCAVLLLVLVLIWPVFSWSQVGEDYNIEIEGRYWMPKLDSTVKVVENFLGTDIKLVDDLGFDDRKNFAEGRLQIKFFKKHKFNLSYLPMKWDADKIITRTIEFAGTSYTVGTRVQSKLDLNFYKVGYEYDFLAGKVGFLGAGIDVLVANVSVALKAPEVLPTPIDEKEDTTIPIPMIGLIGRLYPFKWVNLTAKISGIPLGQYGNVIDAEGSLNINPIKYVGISGGYRYFGVDAKYNDNSLDFKLNGPFVSLNIRF
ncbi:MAG: hypothetical protein HY882_07945 [Deltaproteobacteria bacterium]|nr:hypothetical protein [Deltaproteobacteria bacterium]